MPQVNGRTKLKTAMKTQLERFDVRYKLVKFRYSIKNTSIFLMFLFAKK